MSMGMQILAGAVIGLATSILVIRLIDWLRDR